MGHLFDVIFGWGTALRKNDGGVRKRGRELRGAMRSWSLGGGGLLGGVSFFDSWLAQEMKVIPILIVLREERRGGT